ncbi:hypothetical protein [Streptomyces sp. 4F14]|uniref:hypothetical protein n=1 Tax=Streptomyces sp. 4F14 TaxID=3394380 RepID=UPI003A8AFAE7
MNRDRPVGKSFLLAPDALRHRPADKFLRNACTDQPGWGRVYQQVRRADDVVVPAHVDVDAGRDEYAEELAWFSAHLAFVAVVEGGRR